MKLESSVFISQHAIMLQFQISISTSCIPPPLLLMLGTSRFELGFHHINRNCINITVEWYIVQIADLVTGQSIMGNGLRYKSGIINFLGIRNRQGIMGAGQT